MDDGRHICVVTGSRADYGLLFWLMEEIRADAGLRLSVIATGMHLSERFGHTVNAIHADGFAVIEVPTLVAGDSPLAVAQAVGRGVAGLAEAFDRLNPDLVVVLGDRFEILAAAQAALLLNLPLAHLHGGELTEGAVDDAIRHAITKMAHLHFTANQAYARRVIQMGERPDRVFVTGALGVEAVARIVPLSAAQLAEDLGAPLGAPTFLVTYHPVTLRQGDDTQAVGALLAALDRFPAARVVMTGVNADAGHGVIERLLKGYADARPGRVSLHASLGQRRYLSVMNAADVVIGNSSSGLVEAPAAKVPTVDIGARQEGRLRAASVIHCGETAEEIAQAIHRALDPAFRASWTDVPPPYGRPGAAGRIKAVLKEVELSDLRQKKFVDLPGGQNARADYRRSWC